MAHNLSHETVRLWRRRVNFPVHFVVIEAEFRKLCRSTNSWVFSRFHDFFFRASWLAQQAKTE